MTALVGGEAVAVFRTYDDRVFALSNYDPYRPGVRARPRHRRQPTVGDEEVPFVASPLLKQAFDLRTGACLDEPTVVVPTYEVLVDDGVVSIGARRETIAT